MRLYLPLSKCRFILLLSSFSTAFINCPSPWKNQSINQSDDYLLRSIQHSIEASLKVKRYSNKSCKSCNKFLFARNILLVIQKNTVTYRCNPSVCNYNHFSLPLSAFYRDWRQVSHIDRPQSLISRAAERDHVENPQNSSVIFRDYEHNNARVNLQKRPYHKCSQSNQFPSYNTRILGLLSTLLSKKH